MTTAIGSYATLALVKQRLGGTFDATDDALITSLCDQVNGFIESPAGTGRIIAPRPVGSGVASANEIQRVTLAKGGGTVTGGTWSLTFNGSTTTSLAFDATGATVQTALRALPTVNGANVTVTGDGPYLVEFIGELAGLAQTLMTADASHLTVAPCTVTVELVSTPQTALYYFDGDGSATLYVDVRAVSELAVAQGTGAAYSVVAATEYFLRPGLADREPGWPATRIVLSDVGSTRAFPRGFNTVRLKAVLGWAAIPDEITDVAVTMAVRAWHDRLSGLATDETGAPAIMRFVSARDRDLLAHYRVAPSVR